MRFLPSLRTLATRLLPLPLLLLLLAGLAEAAPQIGKPAPAFAVRDSNGKLQTLADYLDKVVVLEWSNLNCPGVRSLYEEGAIQALQSDYTGKGVAWLTVVSSASGKKGYLSPERGNELLKKHEATPTALLLDETGSMGRAYDARVTPQLFIIDISGVLAYMGGLDGGEDDTPWLTQALDAVLAREPVAESVTSADGCPIHY